MAFETCSQSNKESSLEPLAIVGMAFEFPDHATTEESFWEMLAKGRSAHKEFPADRMNVDSFYHTDKDRPSSIHLRGGHFVSENIAAFDAPFFSINSSEASCMDPQHRRMLEVAYHALEDAGLPIDQISGSDACVYTGCFTNDYLSILQQDYQAEQRHAAMGVAPSMLANRLSWFFNLKGTSMNLDSACSSSLLALHLACQDLRAGTSSMALVGGANLVYHPNFMKFMSEFNFLSPDSRCWSFDERANGYARGEGVSVVVVKRLTDALKHGDTIRAVIRNTGSNQDGRTPGITQPNGLSQISLIKETYRRASLDMSPTQYFEAHGTGTPVGDPIEANAIGTAFETSRSSHTPLYVGAVKASIGHLEGCSGLAGLIKTALVLEKGLIPPIAGLETLNKNINPNSLNLHFPTRLIPWPSSSLRRACINSFGFGGTNVVAILDDTYHFLQQRGTIGFHRTLPSPSANQTFPLQMLRKLKALDTQPIQEAVPRLLVWSTPDQVSAQALTASYQRYLAKQLDISLDDLGYTLSTKRCHYHWRTFCTAQYEAKAIHEASDESKPSIQYSLPSAPARSKENVRLAFVFTGQGSQYLGMGRSLSRLSPFLKSIQASECILKSLGCTWLLTDILDEKADVGKFLDLADISQPVTTCLQIALVDLLASYEVCPVIVLGHSSGEIAAAYAAKAISRVSAVKAAYFRGQLCAKVALTSSNSKLGMMAVALSPAGIESYFQRLKLRFDQVQVTIGCINSPKSITLTGHLTQLESLEALLKEDGVFARMLRVPVAYHSQHMEAVAQEYKDALGVLESTTEAPIPMVSSVTGDIVAPQDLLQPSYWAQNLVWPVKFADAITTLITLANFKPRKQLGKKTVQFQATHIVELGPHRALAGPIQESMNIVKENMRLAYIPSLIRGTSPLTALMHTLGSLFCAGYPINLLRVNNLDQGSPRQAPADMPRYPFNHKNKYWLEGRLSSNFRFGKVARHELLGARNLDWNPKLAQWRNVMRLQELPWLADHTIAGQIVFPGAGYIVIAVEGYKQLLRSSSETSAPLLGLHLKDIAFTRPIRFPLNTDQVETQVTLSSATQSGNEAESWLQFRMFALDNGDYFECCSAYIRGVFNEADRENIASSGPWMAPSWYSNIELACYDRNLDFYDTLHSTSKLQYGPSFQCLQKVRVGAGGEAISDIDTLSWCKDANDGFNPAYMIHPSTLDGLAQLTVPSLDNLIGNTGSSTMVPTRLDDLWLDNAPEALSSGILKIHSATSLRGNRGARANIVGAAEGFDRPVISLRGLETTFIEQGKDTATSTQEVSKELCTRLSWKPDITLMSVSQIANYCVLHRPAAAEDEFSNYQDTLTAIMVFVEEAIANISLESTHPQLPSHLASFTRWMTYQSNLLHNGCMPIQPEQVGRLLSADDEQKAVFFEKVYNSGQEGAFFMEIGRNLLDVLHGKTDPLELIFNGGLANRYYEQMLSNPYHSYPATQYLELLCFHNPAMKILEVGAGTGGQTLRSLEALSTDGVNKWDRYDYTDISPSFFEQARIKFQDYASKLDFRVCNISKSPLQQSFDEGSYDLVIASHVLHATDCLHESLGNIRKLLKPGGKLLLFETTVPEAILAFAFGLLKGWWSPLDNETRSEHSPCISVEGWDRCLRGAGFSGVDFEIPGQENPQIRYSSIMVATAMNVSVAPGHRFSRPSVTDERELSSDSPDGTSMQKSSDFSSTASTIPSSSNKSIAAGSNHGSTEFSSEVDPEAKDHIIILLNPLSLTHCTLAKELSLRLKATGGCCTVESLSSLAERGPSDAQLVVSLLDVDEFFLYGMSASEYRQLQEILMRYKSCLWILRSGCPEANIADPRHGLADGLGRVLMSEDSTRQFTTLSLESSTDDLANSISVMAALVKHVIENTVEDTETKYVIHNGLPYISRVVPDRAMDLTVSQLQRPVFEQMLPFDFEGKRFDLNFATSSARALKWSAHTLGGDTDRKTDHVLVRVMAIGLTEDMDSCPSGLEYAGEVIWAADGSAFQRGQRVCFLAPSTTISSVISIAETSLVVIPTSISYTDAVSLCSPGWIAYQALFNVIRVQTGDSILLHLTALSVLQMVLQFTKSFDISVYISVASEEDRQTLYQQCQAGYQAIFIADQSLPDQIRSATNSHGVDAIIGQLLADDFKSCYLSTCLSPCGRVVDITSMRKTTECLNDSKSSFPTNISYTAVDMQEMLVQNTPIAHSIFKHAAVKAFSLDLKPFLDAKIVSLDSFEDMVVVGQSQKTIVSIEPRTLVSVNVNQNERYQFSSNGTYVIAGGLGGLGRMLARWMAKRGAKHLILLSRSGVSNDKARELVQDLKSQGVCVETPRVDIGNLDALRLAIDNLRNSGMPAIRGCIQASVVLRDNFFDKMSYEDWAFSTDAKVKGSWNLHTVLPDGLDFFILLSSLNGIVGGRAQANYGAGNTFKDALAAYRLAAGEKAVSLDLGLMVSDGVVAENVQLLASLRRVGHLMDIENDEFLAIMDYYCDPALPALEPKDAQLLVGLEMPHSVLAKGVDLIHAIYRPMFRQLFQNTPRQASSNDGKVNPSATMSRKARLAAVKTFEDAKALITGWLCDKLSQILGLDDKNVDPGRAIHTFGIDSLVAIDLKNWLSRDIGAQLEVFTLLSNITVSQLAHEITEKCTFGQ